MGDQLNRDRGECSPGDKLRARIARMDPKKVAAYIKYRTPSRDNIMTKFYFERGLFRRGVPFLVAPPRAKDFRYPPIDRGEVLDLRHGKLKWEEDGFDLVATVEQDDTQADLDYLGELYEREGRAPSGAIPMEKREVYKGEWQPQYWFVPQLDVDAERKAHRGDVTRHEAWLRAQHTLRWDYNRLRQFGQYWWTVGVVVKAYKNGIKLGESSSWGIESDGEDYHAEVAHEVAPEALSEAKETLKQLQLSEAEKDGRVLKTYVIRGWDRAFKKVVYGETKKIHSEGFLFTRYWVFFVTVLSKTETGTNTLVTYKHDDPTGFDGSATYEVEFNNNDWEEIVAYATKELTP